jgi:23S rRNA pseudouridine2605 synthase
MAKKSTKTTKTDDLQPPSLEAEVAVEPKPKVKAKARTKKAVKPAKIVDPIGDETDGEAKTALGPVVGAETTPEIEAAETESLAEAEIEDGAYAGQDLDAGSDAELDPASESEPADATESEVDGEPGLEDEAEPEFNPKPRPAGKLERLQKILAQAGVSSRRKAEELIEQGRVQVNGKIVTELGTKADAGRDHIRVDGKLLQGAERLRYFVLNKPRGFVTTVKDPEGRPTVMQFFDKMRERLYPVGRLDYMSEGLLLVTNDGELANRLTRAAAGVEKTYLVKVAGIPTEAELDILRAGVAIERGKPGSDRVRTSPARVRQVRQGDNPWYEVVLIEGRNRELRKMFEEIGHFVEKIRRVGYGPLVLDQEPGNLRELDPHELELLRKAADGTLRTPKSKELRRRNAADASRLPTVAPRSTGPRPSRPFPGKSFEERPAAGPKDYRPKKSFAQGPGSGGRPERVNTRPASGEFRPARPSATPRFESGSRPSSAPRPPGSGYRPADRPTGRPAWHKDDRGPRPPARVVPGTTSENRPPAATPYSAKPFGAKPYEKRREAGKPYGDRPSADRAYGPKPDAGSTYWPKPAWKKPEGQQRPPFKRPAGGPVPARPAAPRREPDEAVNLGPRTPSRLRIEPVEYTDRPNRPSAPRSNAPYSRPDRPRRSEAPPTGHGRSDTGRPNTGRSSYDRPFRPEGGLARPFTTSSGKPRAGGARPSSKPGKSYGSSEGGSRPASSGGFAPRPAGKTGWKPKSNFGGPPKSGGFSKSGYKSKSSGAGPKRGGKPGGKKRG